MARMNPLPFSPTAHGLSRLVDEPSTVKLENFARLSRWLLKTESAPRSQDLCRQTTSAILRSDVVSTVRSSHWGMVAERIYAGTQAFPRLSAAPCGPVSSPGYWLIRDCFRFSWSFADASYESAQKYPLSRAR